MIFLEAIWVLLTTPLTSFMIIGIIVCFWIAFKPLFTRY